MTTDDQTIQPALCNGLLFAALAPSRLAMVVTDPTAPGHPIVFANGSFLAMTGFDAAEVIGRNCRFLQGPDTDAGAVAELAAAIRDGRSTSVELLNYRRDGTPFWNALHISPIVDQAGRLRWYLGSQMDVTRRREAEAALRQAKTLDAIGQLTGGIAHDFNNLLTVIVGNLDMLEPHLEAPRHRRHAARMRDAAGRAQRLTDRLLAFARRQPLDRQPVDMNALLARLAPEVQGLLGPAITLRIDPLPGLQPCRTDPRRLQAALFGLLANARDAMPGGGVLTIATAHHRLGPTVPEVMQDGATPGDYVALTVSDTGNGMPAGVLRRATEPFFTTKDTGQGSGLGLSMVHGFARQSRGHLRLRSRPGTGTEARLLLPALAALPRADLPPVGGPKTVLVLDAAPEALEAAMVMVDTLGYRALGTTTVAEALAMLEGEWRIDLLLILPGLAAAAADTAAFGVVPAHSAEAPAARATEVTAMQAAEAAFIQDAVRRRPALRVLRAAVLPWPAPADTLGAAVRAALTG